MVIITVHEQDFEIHRNGDIYRCARERSGNLRPLPRKKRALTVNKTTGYVAIGINKKYVQVHRMIAQAYLHDWDPQLQVDHINGNPQDNRIENLRMATAKENRRAYQKHKGYRGVHFMKHNKQNPYKAWIGQTYLGYFATPELAAAAYNTAAKERGYATEALNQI